LTKTTAQRKVDFRLDAESTVEEVGNNASERSSPKIEEAEDRGEVSGVELTEVRMSFLQWQRRAGARHQRMNELSQREGSVLTM
jgi:hypothetical protein